VWWINGERNLQNKKKKKSTAEETHNSKKPNPTKWSQTQRKMVRMHARPTPRFALPKSVPILIAYLLLNIKKRQKAKKINKIYAKSRLYYVFF
jgi:hypothetical protein